MATKSVTHGGSTYLLESVTPGVFLKVERRLAALAIGKAKQGESTPQHAMQVMGAFLELPDADFDSLVFRLLGNAKRETPQGPMPLFSAPGEVLFGDVSLEVLLSLFFEAVALNKETFSSPVLTSPVKAG